MPVFIREDKRVLFVHVPKTGGSSVERLFIASGWKARYLDRKVGVGTANWLRRCSPQHMHADMLNLLFRLDRFDLVFMTVRDPIARFRSEYSMRHRDDLRTDSGLVDAWTDQAFAKYADNPFIHDNHLRPQSEFRVAGAEVYKLEDGLDRAVADLRQRFGLELDEEIPHHMSRAKQSGIPSEQVQISAETDKRLRDFYRDDFALFGY